MRKRIKKKKPIDLGSLFPIYSTDSDIAEKEVLFDEEDCDVGYDDVYGSVCGEDPYDDFTDEELERMGIIEIPKTTKVIDGETGIMSALKGGNGDGVGF